MPKKIKNINKKQYDIVKVIENSNINNNELANELYSQGLTPQRAAELLIELCNHTTIKIDRNGKTHEYIDGNLRFKALDLYTKILGLQSPKKIESKKMNLDVLCEMSDDELNKLLRKRN